jgi:hypothetical protein
MSQTKTSNTMKILLKLKRLKLSKKLLKQFERNGQYV